MIYDISEYATKALSKADSEEQGKTRSYTRICFSSARVYFKDQFSPLEMSIFREGPPLLQSS
jgi:hypothetical protein